MGLEWEAQFKVLEKQLDHERRMRVIARLHDIKVQGAKGLAVLNAGAVIAMFAFVQAMVGKPEFFCFKNYAVYSISFFLVGAFLSTIAFALEYKAIYKSFISTTDSKWHLSTWIIMWISAASALGGGMAAVLGVVRAL